MNNNTTPPNRSSIPADYAKVEIVTSDAVLLKVAQFSLVGEWIKPMDPTKPFCTFYADAQYDYYKRSNVFLPNCLKAILTKYNKIKRLCLELKIYDNRPGINYPNNDRCIVWWQDGVEIKNLLSKDAQVNWWDKCYFQYYQNKAIN
jgi:hypothetical protein